MARNQLETWQRKTQMDSRPPEPRVARKYVFSQDDPFPLPAVFEKFLPDYSDSTFGVRLRSVSQGKRVRGGAEIAPHRLYRPRRFLRKPVRYFFSRVVNRVADRLIGIHRRLHSVCAIARYYGSPVSIAAEADFEPFRARLSESEVGLIVSFSGTQVQAGRLTVGYPHPRGSSADAPRVSRPIARRVNCFVGQETTWLLDRYQFGLCNDVLGIDA